MNREEKRTCKLDNCNSNYHALGFCRIHYVRFKKHGDTETHFSKNSLGLYKTRQYLIWCHLVKRCTNVKHKNYNRYSKLGVCERWLKFKNFWRDMENGYKDDLTIERINNEKGYSKKNCKWATYKEQTRNTRRNRFYEYNGERMIITDWEEKLGFTNGVLRARIDKQGMSFEDAIKTPLKKTKPVKKICVTTNKVMKIYSSLKKAALDNNVSTCNICDCCRKRTKTSNGFNWKYA